MTLIIIRLIPNRPHRGNLLQLARVALVHGDDLVADVDVDHLRVVDEHHEPSRLFRRRAKAAHDHVRSGFERLGPGVGGNLDSKDRHDNRHSCAKYFWGVLGVILSIFSKQSCNLYGVPNSHVDCSENRARTHFLICDDPGPCFGIAGPKCADCMH